MPDYSIQDPDTGMTVVIEGSRPPTQEEAARLIEQARAQQQPPEEPGPVDELIGIGEAALAIGAGAAVEPFAGFAGLMNQGSLAEREQSVQQMRELAYRPRSDVGQRAVQAIGDVMVTVEDKVDRFAEAISFGNPIAATIAKTAILGVPSALGLKSGMAGKVKARKEVADLDKAANELGIDLGSKKIGEQIVEAAGERVVVPARGVALENLQGSLRQARDIEKARMDQLWENARGAGTAGVRAPSMREFLLEEQIFLKDRFDVETMPTVANRLDDLAELVAAAESPGAGFINPAVKLKLVSRYRERLTQIRPSKSKEKENFVLDGMKRRLDRFLDEQFNQDALTGDPQALTAWKEARTAWSAYRKNFKDVKTIKQLVDKDTTVEQVRQWIFGSARMGFKAESGAVVKKLKQILGEDSPQITALRQEFLFDILDPLLSRSPDFGQFLRNYEWAIKNADTLIGELAPFSKTGLNDLARIAEKAKKIGEISSKLQIDLDRGVAVVAFGHDIARKGYIVANAKNILRFLREQTFGTGQRQQMLRELLGYDPNVPLIGKKSLAYTALVSELLSEQYGIKNEE